MPKRYRLTCKQPPTASCPQIRQTTWKTRQHPESCNVNMLAEENPIGEWHFNNHYIISLPCDNTVPRQALLCVRCRRSATLDSHTVEQALRIIHKRNATGCRPSGTRCKIDSSLHALLPREHLKIVAAGKKRLLVCERCGESRSPAQLNNPWGHRHALCHWLAKSGSVSSGT